MDLDDDSSEPGGVPLEPKEPQMDYFLTLAEQRLISALSKQVTVGLFSMMRGSWWGPDIGLMDKLSKEIINNQCHMTKGQRRAFSKALGVAIEKECDVLNVCLEIRQMFFNSFMNPMIKNWEVQLEKDSMTPNRSKRG